MKLVSYVTDHHTDQLGLVLDDVGVVPVTAHLPDATPVGSGQTFVRRFPASRGAIEEWSATMDATVSVPLASLQLNSPIVWTPSIMDCSVAPRHLAQAAEVLLSRSAPSWLRPVVRRTVRAAAPRFVARAQKGGVLHSNRRATNVVGDGVTVPWPDYTSFLDIEPEVAVVVGDIPLGADRTAVEAAVIGYVIYNDISARDVQLREMASGVMSAAKDMDAGSVIGPFLVTPDEIVNPLGLDVTVTTSAGRRWSGTTADYEMAPVELLLDLSSRQSLAAGTIVGMGTVPGTCGLELDEWIEPGETIEITITGLGTLHLAFGHPERLGRHAWGGRP